MPQDGQAKQDCERAAGKRWLRKHAAQIAPQGVTDQGDMSRVVGLFAERTRAYAG